MNWIDLIAVGIAAYFVFRGWQIGIIKAFFRYLSIIAGAIIAICFREPGINWLESRGLFLNDFFMNAISFAGLFLATVIIVQLVGWIIAKVIKPTPLGPVDRISGAIFGGLKTMAILLFLIFLLTVIPLNLTTFEVVKHSFVVDKGLIILPWVKKTLHKHKDNLLAPNMLESLPIPEKLKKKSSSI
ncbi:MAG: CvpA family protein [Fibrobacteria bacterium]|nr:CvpA family protein [Fibrobacteria bacterium]